MEKNAPDKMDVEVATTEPASEAVPDEAAGEKIEGIQQRNENDGETMLEPPVVVIEDEEEEQQRIHPFFKKKS